MKKFIIAIILIAGVQGQANAQLFKKLGNAIEKAAKTVDDVANTVLGESGTTKGKTKDNSKKVNGKPYTIGDTKISIIGDNPGVSITKLHATRVYGSKDVILNMQFYNSSDDSWKIYTEIGYCVAIDDNGNQFKKGGVDMGSGEFTIYRTANTILDDTKLNTRVLFSHVNLDDTRFKRVEMNYYYLDNDCNTHNGTFRMDNVPINLLPSLKADGIYGEGKVLVGAAIASLPASIPYMYDNYTTSQFSNKEGKTYKLVTFTLDGEVMFKAISADQSTISYICVDTPYVQFKVGENFYKIDDYLYRDDKFCTPNANGDLTFKGLTLKREKNKSTYKEEIKCVYAGLSVQ